VLFLLEIALLNEELHHWLSRQRHRCISPYQDPKNNVLDPVTDYCRPTPAITRTGPRSVELGRVACARTFATSGRLRPRPLLPEPKLCRAQISKRRSWHQAKN